MDLRARLSFLMGKEKTFELTTELEKLKLEARVLKEDDIFIETRVFQADVFYELGDVKKAIKLYHGIIDYCKDERYQNLRLDLINKMLPYYKYSSTKVKLYELLKEKELLLNNLEIKDESLMIDLALANYELAKFDKAQELYHKILSQNSSFTVQSQVYTQLAKIMVVNGDYTKARMYIENSNELINNNNSSDYYGLLINKHLSAKIYIKENQINEAKNILLEVYDELGRLANKKTILPIITLLEVLVKQGDMSFAKQVVDSYDNLIEKDNNINVRRSFYQLCTKIYHDTVEQKLQYTEKLLSLVDELTESTKNLEEQILARIDSFEKNKESNEQLFSLIVNTEKLIDFIGSIDNKMTFRDMFMAMNDYVSQFIEFEESTIIRVKEYDERFSFYHYKKGRVYDRIKMRDEFDETAFNQLFITKKELAINNVSELNLIEPFSGKSFSELNISAVIAFPLIDNTNNSNRLIGMLAFYNKDGKTFESDTTQMLLKIVSHLYAAKLINVEYSQRVSNLKDVYEVALSNTDTGIIYSRDYVRFEISNHLLPILGVEGVVNVETLYEAFADEDQKTLRTTLEELQFDSLVSVPSLELRTKNNKYVKIEINIKHLEGEFSFISMKLTDITNTKGTIDSFSTMAFNDKLTGLRNRASLLAKLEELRVEDKKFTLLMMDLNGFKSINDTFGHVTGDNVLMCVADALRKVFKEEKGYIPYRQSGDEFVVILEDVISKPLINSLVNDYVKELKKGYTKDLMTQIPLASSIGAVRYPTDTKNREKVVTYADSAMYAVKAKKNVMENYYFKYFDKTDLLKEQMQDPRAILGLDDEIN